MVNRNITRRQCLLGACGLGLGMAVGVKAETPSSNPINVENAEPYPRNASEALARLKDGNRRFMDDRPRHAHENISWRSLLVETQRPFATILGCSDSRVPPELIFDAGFGELFTIRLAGNIISEDVIGSLQYAVVHLHIPLIVVLGHEGCGAVTATVEEMLDKVKEPERIESLIQLIKPGLSKLDLKQSHSALLSAAVEANVRWSIQQLSALPERKRIVVEKRAILMGGVYELATGRVRFLD
ncbi:carbonic anhydrase [Nitrosomonas sp. JL21]|uniref:carbonic anhydrase n=1 Tax=Nitrosomonas sp. JL21 TaxID=153949 RepID=UPI00136AF6AA|nr:carbonic anhydrase [Nitrosomonas sp. JL21]MBL8497039.1 carbonic anhydrase [Nitrosomonas sp.]MXS78184.1 carbonic anhydrase [Nitrosomonas sp. JL21]